MRAWLAWSNIFPAQVAGWVRSGAEKCGFHPIGGNGLWFRELEMDDVTARQSLPRSANVEQGTEAPVRWLRRVIGVSGVQPGICTVRNADLILDRAEDWVRVSGAHFTMSETAAGSVRAAQIAIRTQSGRQSFSGVRGRTSLEGSRVTIAGLKLTHDVTVQSLSVSPGEFAKGRLMFSAA